MILYVKLRYNNNLYFLFIIQNYTLQMDIFTINIYQIFLLSLRVNIYRVWFFIVHDFKPCKISLDRTILLFILIVQS